MVFRTEMAQCCKNFCTTRNNPDDLSLIENIWQIAWILQLCPYIEQCTVRSKLFSKDFCSKAFYSKAFFQFLNLSKMSLKHWNICSCPFIQILFRFHPDFILILSISNLDKIWIKLEKKLYPNFIQILYIFFQKWIKWGSKNSE